MDNKSSAQLGMIGLGRMGADMVRRLLKGGHRCVVFDLQNDITCPLSNNDIERSRVCKPLSPAAVRVEG